MFEKIQTLAWFLARPSFWPHMTALIARKFNGSARHDAFAAEAQGWAAPQAVPVEAALSHLGVLAEGQALPPGLDPALIAEGEARAARSGVAMGGPGDLDLIHRAILVTGAKRALETGVAYGWSSLAALAALDQTGGRLASVDMPYPKAGNESFVGIAVPEGLRARWTLVRQPDRNGIHRALAALGGSADFIHYDSDKSYAGRAWSLPILWAALTPGGLFISDDIQDNFHFRDFVGALGLPFAITESGGKYVGIVRKPGKAE